jgi:hypothetical protein
MKNDCSTMDEPEQEVRTPAPEGVPDNDTRQAELKRGRSGEGAHSAMKHWLHEERLRIKRPEH